MKRLQVEGWKVEGWKVERLGDVVEFQRGLTYSKKDEVESSSNIVLRANNVDLNTNALDFTELKYIKDKLIVPKEKKVAKGSLIICTASGSKSHLGKVALIDKNYDYAFGGFMGQITPKKIIDSKFLFYRMISEEYKRFIGKLSDGVNINNLRFDDLAQFEIPLPPLPEQKRIVSLLDETFAALAKVHDNAARNLVNAREVFESVQREIFSNGKGWKETTLGEVAENLDSQRIPVTKRDRKEGKYPYYGASGIVDYVDKFIFNEDLLLVSEDGANLLARTYPIAFSISGKTWVNNHAHVLRFEKMETQKFIEYYLNSIPLDEYVSGMAQPKLNQAMLNSIPIHLPPLPEQSAIVARLEALSQSTRRLEEVYQSKRADVEELRKSVLKEVFQT